MQARKIFLPLISGALLCAPLLAQEPLPEPETHALPLPAGDRIWPLAHKLIEEWEHYHTHKNPNFDVETLKTALFYANEMHKGQTRKDAAATPYIIHPLQVCHQLWKIGKVRNSNILIAALLHDTIEDTAATAEEIELLFGPRVLATVLEVTNDPTLSTAENKQRQIDHVPLMSQDARLVKLSDRLANVRDLASVTWPEEKIAAYKQWGEKLLTALRGTNAPLEHALNAALHGRL